MRLRPSPLEVFTTHQAGIDVDIRQTDGTQLFEIEIENIAMNRIEVKVTVAFHGSALSFRGRDSGCILVDVWGFPFLVRSFLQSFPFFISCRKHVLSIAIMLL